jgi:hypothetical protein
VDCVADPAQTVHKAGTCPTFLEQRVKCGGELHAWATFLIATGTYLITNVNHFLGFVDITRITQNLQEVRCWWVLHLPPGGVWREENIEHNLKLTTWC